MTSAGSSDAARSAGATAARRPVTVAMAAAREEEAGRQVHRERRRCRRGSSRARRRRSASPAPRADADERAGEPEDARPGRGRSGRPATVRVPIALRIPISRDFWTTETTRTLAMPRATATTTKNWIIQLEALWDLQPDEELLVQLHPAVGLQAGPGARSPPRRVSASKISVDLQLDRRDPARQIEERLGGTQGDEDPPLRSGPCCRRRRRPRRGRPRSGRRASSRRTLSPTETPRSDGELDADHGVRRRRRGTPRPSSGDPCR